MSAPYRMLADMAGQADSLAEVLRWQRHEGRSALEGAASILRGAARVVVTGMGASLNAGLLLEYYLRRHGLRNVAAIDAAELLHFGGDTARDAAVVVFSRSGETVEAVKLLPNLRAAGSTVVAIVNEPESVLAREADECVIVRSRPDEAVAVQSYTGTAFVALLLASLVADEDRWSEAEQCIGAVRRALDECARRPCLLPAGCRVVYALGRGPSVASALEGALLFHETAKLPCVGMPAGNFRHGPFEAVDGSFHSFVIASSPETRKLDEALRDQIRGFGGTAEWISVEPGHFAPVAEVIPLQFAAYHAALARGFVPGKFRYVTLVTTSETEFGASGGRS
jgi:glucosamine--fructose-6-phosphate aminotransferase (isomerizing)